jgi:hypothetical protein
MEWLKHVTDIMDKYGSDQTQAVPSSVEADFDRLTQHAPPNAVSDGLAEAFRSNQTPPFGNMLSELFRRSPATQKTSVLNTLVSALGPTLVAQMLARHGAARAAKEVETRQNGISPEVADEVPATSIEEIAKEAEQRDPSIIDRISKFYAEQPALLKTLGGLALTVAMAKVAQRQSQPQR